jgi:hypothetical protein
MSKCLHLVLCFGFCVTQHMPAVRQVFNPLEKDDVIGITNYVDVGLQLNVPLKQAGPAATAAAAGQAANKTDALTGSSSSSSDGRSSTQAGLRLAAAWQVSC